MVRIEACIRPFEIDVFKEALRDAGISGVTACDVTVIATAPGAPRWSWTRLDTVVHDDLVERVVAAITRATKPAHSTAEIWLTRVAMAVRIRTGEIDEAAIF
jgi:nitrogen regulatory protein PII